MSILTVNSGSAFQIECLEGDYAEFFDTVIRPEHLSSVDLTPYDAVLIPCRTPGYRMEPHADALRKFLDTGKTVVAMGECHSERWLPGIDFAPCKTNFWWWMEPDGDLGTRVTQPDHPLFRFITDQDICWHLHGDFDAPAGTEVLAVGPNGRAILYIDEITTPGRMIVTSLDPRLSKLATNPTEVC